MTAKEILLEGNEGLSISEVINGLTEDQILECFDSYAKQQAVDFAEYVSENSYTRGSVIYWWDKDKESAITITELYAKFQESQQSKHLPADEVEKDFDKKKEY